MSRYLSQPEAWREIARRVAEGEWVGLGLCREVWRLESAGLIDWSAKCEMLARAMDHVHTFDGRCVLFAYPAGCDANARVLAALWMALEAEDERQSSKRAGSLAGGTET